MRGLNGAMRGLIWLASWLVAVAVTIVLSTAAGLFVGNAWVMLGGR